MELTVMKDDAVVLVYHMDVMRKSVSSGFKKSHGQIKGRKMYKTYRTVLQSIEEQIMDQHGNDEVVMDLMLNDEQFEMLFEFLKFYVHELEVSAAKDGINANDHPGFKPLQNILYAAIIADQADPVVM